MNPLVTIAIPAYKSGRLHETIASALAQTYANTEIVIVNDQSPEEVEAVVATFSDTRIRYFMNEKNVGRNDPSRNWNECLRRARGEWFCLLCDDDQYAPIFVETMLQLAGQHPQCNVLRSCVSVTDGDGREMSRYPASPDLETVEQYMWDLYHGRRRQTISEFMLRTSAIRDVGGYVNLPYAWGSDNLSIFRFALKGGIASTSDCLTVFCDSGANISSDGKCMDKKLEAFRQYICATKEMVLKQGFRSDLLPVIDAYYRRACTAHMMEADRQAFCNIVSLRNKLTIPWSLIVKAFLKRGLR